MIGLIFFVCVNELIYLGGSLVMFCSVFYIFVISFMQVYVIGHIHIFCPSHINISPNHNNEVHSIL